MRMIKLSGNVGLGWPTPIVGRVCEKEEEKKEDNMKVNFNFSSIIVFIVVAANDIELIDT